MRSCNTVSVVTQLLVSCSLLVLVSTTPRMEQNTTKGYLKDIEPVDEDQSEGPSPRIVGGQYAADGQFPHQISLYIFGDFTCGGSIISANYVVTAAHCVTSKPGSNYPAYYFTVRAGSSQLYSGGEYVRVAETKVHPQYRSFVNDIALLRLGSKLTLCSRIKAIPLASAEPPSGSAVIISGFGRVRTNGELSTRLKYNTLRSISNAQCNRLVRGVASTTLCLSHTAGNGACNGDSGGPGVYNGQLVGVSNYIVNGCGSTYPDGYAKVPSFRNWLRQNSDLP
ncbi:serine protease SP24D [Zeugodacus cucurbitae]|uniref:serine protease SP24D n=1 Tax=Zeugodacus cucurbitae TaxID=28588 RepID=UPI0023D8FE2B|nr:serine protease SP24D [Zeugodacus cucurbitae]